MVRPSTLSENSHAALQTWTQHQTAPEHFLEQTSSSHHPRLLKCPLTPWPCFVPHRSLPSTPAQPHCKGVLSPDLPRGSVLSPQAPLNGQASPDGTELLDDTHMAPQVVCSLLHPQLLRQVPQPMASKPQLYSMLRSPTGYTGQPPRNCVPALLNQPQVVSLDHRRERFCQLWV